MDKYNLLKQITALDFSIIDLHLYLNTHPTDCKTLAKYNTLVMQCKMLKNNYEKQYGILSYNTASNCPWQWINEPWPWEYEANFKL